jgi:hypothetical protein
MRLPHCLLLIAGSSLAGATLAQVDAYPVKPVRFVVAFPPGGNADFIARIAGQRLSDALGRSFVIDNRGGAGGIIGEELVARSAPDGYTILLVSIAHVVNPALRKKLSYDPFKDLAPVSLVSAVPNALVVHTSVNVKTVPELIALAKSKPGSLNFASSHGTSLHIAGELFKTMAGVDIVNINYKSGGVAIPDVEAGRVQLVFSVITTALSLARQGRTRVLAVTSAKRSQVAPELPAIAEFVPGYASTGWQGILAPAGTPPAIIAKLSAAIAEGMRRPEVRSGLLATGADPVGSTPGEFAAFRTVEFEKLSKLGVKAGIKAEQE